MLLVCLLNCVTARVDYGTIPFDIHAEKSALSRAEPAAFSPHARGWTNACHRSLPAAPRNESDAALQVSQSALCKTLDPSERSNTLEGYCIPPSVKHLRAEGLREDEVAP